MTSIYLESVDKRIKRLKTTLCGRDYEGTTTVLTSDLIETLNYIDYLEKENDEGSYN